MSALWRDLRQAARALRSNPGLVALATLSLALGIGANVTVYTWARATLSSRSRACATRAGW